ncbi:hypothetical protein LTR53_010420 [Teratosphaeriaceae sp. CCFEE 6253]|nr:hypothetical protein LTR53_010420 [Teratosphaeriaceae sp. CCFEE 6253]
MSTSGGGGTQPPGQPPGSGGALQQPSPQVWPAPKAQNGWNNWTKNTKVKTAKCDLCSERIKYHSWDCDACGKRLCSECADPSGGSNDTNKYIANDHLEDKCHCAYPLQGGRRPGLQQELLERGLVQHPPLRTEEDAENKRIKAETAKRKKEAGAAQGGKVKKQKITAESPTAGGGATASDSKPQRTGRATDDREIVVLSEDEPETVGVSGSAPEKSHSAERRTGKMPAKDHAAAATPCVHLDGGSTVVVGGGIVGLYIAFELASKTKATKTRHTITVIEIRGGCCQLASASGSCAGILNRRGLGPELDGLLAVTMAAWNERFSDPGFRTATGITQDNVHRVRRFDGKGREKYMPSWFTGFGDENFQRDEEDSMGTIDTGNLAGWLFGQCQDLGVNFIFNHDVRSIHSDPGQNVSSIEIQRIMNLEDRQGPRQTIQCQNVILAAGPWTTGILKALCPKSKLDLGNNVKEVLWVRVNEVDMAKGDSIALLLPDVACDDDTLEDEVTMTGRHRSRQVIIAGVSSKSINDDVQPPDAIDPQLGEAKPLHHLQRLAERRLGGITDSDHTTEGFALVSTSARKLPIIDRVPASASSVDNECGADIRQSGVWLCFGFGFHGTTLAPGAARVLCRRLFGKASGIDDNAFGISKNTAPLLVQSGSSD